VALTAALFADIVTHIRSSPAGVAEKEVASMRHIIKVLGAAALMAVLMATYVSPAFADKPTWAQPEDPPPKYGWGANPELCDEFSEPGCGFAYGKNK
jgi:hypothetical protein